MKIQVNVNLKEKSKHDNKRTNRQTCIWRREIDPQIDFGRIPIELGTIFNRISKEFQ